MAFGDSPILSVSVASETTVRIKPCEPVFVILDVTAGSSRDQETMREPPPELARHVLVNDRSYGARMTGVNAVAFFLLNKSSVKTIDDDIKSFQVVAIMYWNAEDEDYLFNSPGLYHVEFHPEARVDVIVEQPTREEQRIVAQMEDLGVVFALFVLDPTDYNRGKAVSPRVEQMLEEHPDTAYTRYLSIPLGIYKFYKERPKPGPDRERYLVERRKVKKYFEPYCKGEIKSLLEAGAAYHLAMIELEESRAGPHGRSPEAETTRRHAIALLEKVKNSPYAVDLRSKAEYELRELRKASPPRPSSDRHEP
ncbi:MAG: hypothetical protein WBE26_01035 [Phycisphaerae bacterium]